MSMCAPQYYKDPEFQRWYDFRRDCFKKGAPQKVIDTKKHERRRTKKRLKRASACKRALCEMKPALKMYGKIVNAANVVQMN